MKKIVVFLFSISILYAQESNIKYGDTTYIYSKYDFCNTYKNEKYIGLKKVIIHTIMKKFYVSGILNSILTVNPEIPDSEFIILEANKYIGINGIDYEYSQYECFDFSGIISVQLKNKKWMVLGKDLQPLTNILFDQTYPTSFEGVYAIQKNKKWGLINKEGKILTPIYDIPNYEDKVCKKHEIPIDGGYMYFPVNTINEKAYIKFILKSKAININPENFEIINS